MTWEFLADHIRNKIEKIKGQLGFLTVSHLESLINENFGKLQRSDVFEEEFEGINVEVRNEWLSKIKLRLKSVIATSIDPNNIIDGGITYERWIDKRVNPINWNYSERYFQYLKKLGRPVDIINSTEKSTKEIIERLGDPLDQLESLQKGLVLGSVQSGKTANFNGVINRAIDVGYDLIIIFSGIMEDLRLQTQKRINNDVIGVGEVNNQINQIVGVGRIHTFGMNGINQITSITSTSTDFRKSLVDANIDFINPRLLVCKKNVSVLTNLIYWLRSSMAHGEKRLSKRLLVIDDEADNASLNNLGHKGALYASKVNGNIRALLNLFERRSYLGYTATPFANILQDQNEEPGTEEAWKISFRYNGQIQDMLCSLSPNLFPDKFIYKLAEPSSYLGPKRFFSNGREKEGDSKIPLIETIPPLAADDIMAVGDNGHKLRKSLADAIDCFVLSIALRDSRYKILEALPGYTKHHTMLVHISRLIEEQITVTKAISEYIVSLQRRIADESMNEPSGIYQRMKLQWNRFFAYKVENITSFLPSEYNSDGLIPKTWEEISTYLPNAVQNINVKAINSQTGDKLEYNESSPKKYIAIGGNRLSRGFTLDGLSINYFLRDTYYYDALLQMGRWFGYRPGYIDACRLFIDFETEEKYNFITAALTELEELIESMELQKKKPKDFELRIRKHPDVLKITRAAILKNAQELRYSYQDMVQQSTIFRFNGDIVKKSWEAFKVLFYQSGFLPDQSNDGFYSIDGDKQTLFQFLDLPATYVNETFEKESLKEYINKCSEQGKLTNWKIAIKRTGTGNKINEPGLNLSLSMRSAPDKLLEAQYYAALKENLEFTASGKSMNIMTAGMDESFGLDTNTVKDAIEEFRKEKEKKFIANGISAEIAKEKAKTTTIPGRIFRKVRNESEGLLLIYLMDLKYVFKDELLEMAAKNKIDLNIPFIGYALSFPEIKDDPGAVYMTNRINKSSAEEDLLNEGLEEPDDINNNEHSDIK